MALEDLTGTKYIDDLNSSNPAAGDNVSEGDDHIRGIKNVLKVTLPNVTGAVTPTHTELNYVDGVTSAVQTQLDAKLPLAGGAMTGAITTNSTFDGVDIATRDAILTSTTTTAGAALPKAGGAMTGAITTNSTFDGVDIATRDAVLTSTTTTANAALPKAGGTMTGSTIHNDSIKDIYGTDSDLELYHSGSHGYITNTTGDLIISDTGGDVSIQAKQGENSIVCQDDGAVKLYYDNALKLQTVTGGVHLGDSSKVLLGDSDDLQLYHDGSHSYVDDAGTGNLYIRSNSIILGKYTGETMVQGSADGAVDLYHDSSKKFETTAGGVAVTGNLYATGNIGLDVGDKISWTDNSHTSFTVNGNEEMRLEADGDLHVDGDVIAYSTTISDATLKYNINPVEFALDKIKQLKGVTFNYLKGNKASAGLLAQDVEKVMPSAVSERKLPLHTGDDKSYKTLHYDSMTAILVEAIKELTAKVEKLEKK
jgi:hypothetical protein